MSGALQVGVGYYEDRVAKAQAEPNRNREYTQIQKCLTKGSCPIIFRKMVEAELEYDSRLNKQPIDRRCRTKLAFAIAPGGLNFFYRLGRVVVRTLGLTLTVPVAARQASRFHLEGGMWDHVKHTLKGAGNEWVDMATFGGTWLLSLAKFLKPDLMNGTTEKVRHYYIRRIDNGRAYELLITDQKEEFNETQEEIKRCKKQGLPPPQLDDNYRIVAPNAAQANPVEFA